MKKILASLLLFGSFCCFASYTCSPRDENLFFDNGCYNELKLSINSDLEKITVKDTTEDCFDEEQVGKRVKSKQAKYADLFSDSGCSVDALLGPKIVNGESIGVITFITAGECEGEIFKYDCEQD